MSGDAAYIELFAPARGAGVPAELVQGLVEALDAIGKRGWWNMRFWDSDQVGGVVATYTAFNPDPENASAFISSVFNDYQISIGRSTGARWSVGQMQPIPTLTWRGPDPEAGKFAIRYAPGLSLYSDDYVPEEQVVDIFGGYRSAQLGFLHDASNRYAGGKGGGGSGLFEPATIELVVGAALTAYALSIVSAIGTDTWVALKKAVRRMRRHRSKAISSAMLSVAIAFGENQWLVIRTYGRQLDEDALASLEVVPLPRLPIGDFELIIELDSESDLKVSFGGTWSRG